MRATITVRGARQVAQVLHLIARAVHPQPGDLTGAAADGLKAAAKRLQARAEESGLPTGDELLSPVTQALKGHGRYAHETGRLFGGLHMEVHERTDSAEAVAIPAGESTHARNAPYALIARWLQEGAEITPEKVGWEKWGRIMAAIRRQLRDRGVVVPTEDGDGAIVIPPRPFFVDPVPEEITQAAKDAAVKVLSRNIQERLTKLL